MTLILTPSLTIRVQRTVNHAWRRIETRSRHFLIYCWTLYWFEVTVFRYRANEPRRVVSAPR